MTKRLIDRDPITGEAVWYEYRAADDSAVITHTQDVQSILERNIASANDDAKTARGIKQDFWKYAEIPNIVWIKWKQERGVDIFDKNQKKELFALLNSPEYSYLKTTRKFHDGR
jgi:hypothetical protein